MNIGFVLEDGIDIPSPVHNIIGVASILHNKAYNTKYGYIYIVSMPYLELHAIIYITKSGNDSELFRSYMYGKRLKSYKKSIPWPYHTYVFSCAGSFFVEGMLSEDISLLENTLSRIYFNRRELRIAKTREYMIRVIENIESISEKFPVMYDNKQFSTVVWGKKKLCINGKWPHKFMAMNRGIGSGDYKISDRIRSNPYRCYLYEKYIDRYYPFTIYYTKYPSATYINTFYNYERDALIMIVGLNFLRKLRNPTPYERIMIINHLPHDIYYQMYLYLTKAGISYELRIRGFDLKKIIPIYGISTWLVAESLAYKPPPRENWSEYKKDAMEVEKYINKAPTIFTPTDLLEDPMSKYHRDFL